MPDGRIGHLRWRALTATAERTNARIFFAAEAHFQVCQFSASLTEICSCSTILSSANWSALDYQVPILDAAELLGRDPAPRSVLQLATERYEGADLTELISEREGINLSRPTVRRIRTWTGVGNPRSRRSPQHRFRGQRMVQVGC